MSYIDSSTASPLAAVAHDPAPGPDPQGPDPESEEDEEEEERRQKEKPPAGSRKDDLIKQIDDINLARYIDQPTLDRIGIDCVREFEIDDLSREDWLQTTKEAMDLATQKIVPKTTPWPGASSMVYPLVAQAALEFHARTYPAIVQNKKVVQGVVWGTDRGTPVTDNGEPDGKPMMQPDPQNPQQQVPVWLIAPGEKRKRADRIGEHMSWQLLQEMPEWEPQTDQLLLQIPVTGGAVRKTFRDPIEGRNKSLFVSLANIVWNYRAPSFEAAPRHTEKVLLYPTQIVELERQDADDEDEGGMFLPLDYGTGGGRDEGFGFSEADPGDNADPDAPHLFIEQHRRLDLDDDGYAEPYVVTVHLRSSKVVRIVARYDEEGIEASEDGDTINRILPVEHYTLYPFFPNFDGGSYPMGFGHILKQLSEGISTTLNQMFDAGKLQNAGGGFVSDQLGVASGQTLFQVGKYVRVNAKGGNIRDAVFPLPFQGPSPTLFQLLGVLVSAGEKLGSIGNILAGDASIANAPPTTVLALIEQGMKVYTGINKRIFRAEKAELAKLYRLNRKFIKTKASYQLGDEWKEVTEEDYRLGGGVDPIADPTMTTDMQKLARGQILMGFNNDPLIDQREIRRRLFEAASIDRIDEIIVPENPQAEQVAAQMQMETAQANLGKLRSEELKNQTQAFLNMALARKNADAKEEGFIEAQLTYLRLSIEATNSTIKAAAVDHKFHDTNTRSASEAAQRTHEQALAAAPQPGGEGAEPTPGPTGAFPAVPDSAAPPTTPDVVNPGSPGTGNPNVPGGPLAPGA